MTHRIGAAFLFGALCLSLTACPPSNNTPDGNDVEVDAGNPPPRDACSGGCSANQLCDTKRRICVDACGGCDAGTCVKVMEGVYQCRSVAVTCNNNLCEPGQIACIGGSCACLASARSSEDSCRGEGKWCNGTVCGNPKRYEQCVPGSEAAKCPSGHICDPVFGEDMAICVKDCSGGANVCDRGEFCAGLDTGSGCLPAGLFRDQECNQNIPLPDGGLELDGGTAPVRITVPVSNTCLLKDGSGVITDQPGKGSGNCTYALFKFWDEGVYPFRTCRPPGNATLGQACRADYSTGAVATQCGTGLECAPTRGGDQGVCLKACNANPPSLGFTPQPACDADESCVNLYRYTDPNNNAVLGVCMKKCNVFDAATSTCAPVGTATTSCVPTMASGEIIVSSDGAGICVPQQATIAQPGAECTETDPFRGAACGSGQLCTSASLDELAKCTPVCDLSCIPSADGGTPSRCATEPNARCSAGKTCKRVTSTTGAVVGFCL